MQFADLSNAVADVVERNAAGLVSVHGRRRPASGIVWAQDQVVTASHVVRREEQPLPPRHQRRSRVAKGIVSGPRHRVLRDRADAQGQTKGRQKRSRPEEIELRAAEEGEDAEDDGVRDHDRRNLVPTDIGFLAGPEALISLGAAVAIQLAGEVEAEGVIAECAFNSVRGMALKNIFTAPAALTLRSRFDSVEGVKHIKCPLLSIHGARDSLAPVRMGRAIYDAATVPKRWYEITAAGHNDTVAVGGEEYWATILEFVSNG